MLEPLHGYDYDGFEYLSCAQSHASFMAHSPSYPPWLAIVTRFIATMRVSHPNSMLPFSRLLISRFLVSVRLSIISKLIDHK